MIIASKHLISVFFSRLSLVCLQCHVVTFKFAYLFYFSSLNIFSPVWPLDYDDFDDSDTHCEVIRLLFTLICGGELEQTSEVLYD